MFKKKLILIPALLFALTSCGGDQPTSSTTTTTDQTTVTGTTDQTTSKDDTTSQTVEVESVTIKNKDHIKSVCDEGWYVGSAAIELDVEILPAGSLDPFFAEYTTSDPSVASVSSGTVVAIGEGTATITVTAGDFSDSVEVTVSGVDTVSIAELRQHAQAEDHNDAFYNFDGVVIAQLYNGPVIEDETGYVYAYKCGQDLEVGDYVLGTTQLDYYNGLHELVNATFEVLDEEPDFEQLTTPVVWDAEDVDAYKGGCTLFEAVGELKASGTYYNIYIDGADHDLSIYGSTNGAYDDYIDKYVKVVGYPLYLAGDIHVNFALKSIEETTVVKDPVTSVTLTQPGTTELEVGTTLQLEATVLPATADQHLTWKTSDETKASVDKNGLVTAKAVGEVTITVESAVTPEFKDEITLTIKEATQVGEVELLSHYDFTTLTGTGEYDENDKTKWDLNSEDLDKIKGTYVAEGCIEDALVSFNGSKAYEGGGSGGAHENEAGLIKLGSSSSVGTLDFTFKEEYNIAKVEIIAHDFYAKSDSYPTNQNKVKVNNATEVLLPYNETGDGELVTFTGNFGNDITITVANRGYIFDLKVYVSEGGIDVPPVVEDEYSLYMSYDFSNLTGKGSQISSTAAVDILNSSFVEAESIENGLVSATTENVYNGNGSDGWYENTAGLIKIGTSSKKGVLTLTLNSVSITKIEMTARDWNGTKGDKIQVNTEEPQALPTTENTLVTFEGNFGNSITITSDKRGFIFDLKLYVDKVDDAGEVTGIELDKTELDMYIGETYTLKASLRPLGIDKIVNWESSDTDVATVDENGTITAKTSGTATITAKVDLVSASCTVNVVGQRTYNISQVTEEGQYIVRGVIVAKSEQGLVITDGTDSIYVYNGYTGTFINQHKIGEYVEVNGSVESYNLAFQFTEDSIVTKLDEQHDITPAAAIDLTNEIVTGFSQAGEFGTDDIKLYKWTATASLDGKFLLLNLEGCTINIEPMNVDDSVFPYEVGKTYNVEGYFIGFSQNHSYAAFILTKLELVA